MAVGKVNAISGERWNQTLDGEKQDYILCPDQPWLDGINSGEGYIRQFIAMPLGMGYTVESQVTGKEELGGIQIIVFDPKLGKFRKPQHDVKRYYNIFESPMETDACGMGIAAGGKMKQEIFPDEYGVETWDENNYGRVYIHIVNSMMYREITGMEPPPTPVTAKMYTDYGYPWFELYDEGKGDLTPSLILEKVKSVKQIDQEKVFSTQQDDTSIEITQNQIKKIKSDSHTVMDGNW